MQELERILMKRHKVGQRELSLGRYILHRYMNVFQRKYVSERHTFVCCLGQHIFLHHYCLSMSSPHFFLFESSVCKSDKGANSSEIGDPWNSMLNAHKAERWVPSRAAMVIWYKLQTIVEIPILQKEAQLCKKAMLLFLRESYCIWFRKIRIL